MEHGVEPLTGWLETFWKTIEQKTFHDLYGLFPVDKNQAMLYLQVIAVQMRQGLQNGTFYPEDFLAVGKALDELRQQANPRLVLEGLALTLFEQIGGQVSEQGGGRSF